MLDENKILVEWNITYNKYVVSDGVHRLALLKYNNYDLNSNWFKLK
jgi:hypothetical protein